MAIPSLAALRAFEAAARKGSFSRAADELCVTHAAVSHQVRNLEDWFGAPLVARQGRGIRLTAAGEVLARRLKPVFAEIDAACTRVRHMTRGGTLSVGCIPSVAARWLIPRLPEFMERYAEVEIRVVYASADERLRDTSLDVLITYGEDEEAGTQGARLFSRMNKPVCSPSFLKERGPFKDCAAISSAPLLHDERRESWSEWLCRAGLDRATANAGPVFQDFNMLATAVIAGHGIGLCPVEIIRPEIEAGDLIVLSDIAINTEKAYFVRWRHDCKPVVEAFVGWFQRAVRSSSS